MGEIKENNILKPNIYFELITLLSYILFWRQAEDRERQERLAQERLERLRGRRHKTVVPEEKISNNPTDLMVSNYYFILVT